MKTLLVFDRWIEKFAVASVVVLLSIMILLAFGQVILRQIFHTAMPGVDVLLRHLVLWVGYFGAIIATGHGRHLRIEIVDMVFSPRVRVWCAIVANVFAAVICGVLLRASISFVSLERESSMSLLAGLPSWIFAIVVPVGYALIAFRFVVRAVDLLGGAPPPSPDTTPGVAEASGG